MELAQKIDDIVNTMIAEAALQMKVDSNKVDIILVGGGVSIVNPDYLKDDNVKIPDNSEVANAVGASIAQTSGSVEVLVAMKGKNKDQVVQEIINEAEAIAVKSGADKETIEVVQITKSPLSYHPEEAYVINTKVIGDLLFK